VPDRADKEMLRRPVQTGKQVSESKPVSSIVCRRCVVSGRVQGVWFRASTREKARELGLTGRAVNLPDGRVEVIACGPEDRLRQLEGWLWQGPDLARVESVECAPAGEHGFSDFSTG
jgi:acylphosphatase